MKNNKVIRLIVYYLRFFFGVLSILIAIAGVILFILDQGRTWMVIVSIILFVGGLSIIFINRDIKTNLNDNKETLVYLIAEIVLIAIAIYPITEGIGVIKTITHKDATEIRNVAIKECKEINWYYHEYEVTLDVDFYANYEVNHVEFIVEGFVTIEREESIGELNFSIDTNIPAKTLTTVSASTTGNNWYTAPENFWYYTNPEYYPREIRLTSRLVKVTYVDGIIATYNK